jgi:protein MpaA
VQGRPLRLIEVGQGREIVLVFGGFHGDEEQGAYVAERLATFVSGVAAPPPGRKVVVVPMVNPDGIAASTRDNARGVDLNRNFPTRTWRLASGPSAGRHGSQPASEPETRLVIELIDHYRPACIISIHTISRGKHCVNYDGPADGLAVAMAERCAYPVKPYIGYPTPGSLGTYAGIERGIPIVTLEMPSGQTDEACWQEVRGALSAAVRFPLRVAHAQAGDRRAEGR